MPSVGRNGPWRATSQRPMIAAELESLYAKAAKERQAQAGPAEGRPQRFFFFAGLLTLAVGLSLI